MSHACYLYLSPQPPTTTQPPPPPPPPPPQQQQQDQQQQVNDKLPPSTCPPQVESDVVAAGVGGKVCVGDEQQREGAPETDQGAREVRLPFEVIQRVFACLDGVDLARVASVHSSWAAVLSSSSSSSGAVSSPAASASTAATMRRGLWTSVDFTSCSPWCVDDALVLRVCQAQPNIASVDLSFCTAITDRALSSIGSNLTGLRRLRVEGLRALSGRGLVHLALAAGETLEELDLGGCLGVTLDAFKEIARRCKRLETIWLNGVMTAGNRAVSHLSRLPQLRRIGLNGSFKLTDPGVVLLSRQAGERLEELDLSYCSKVAGACLEHVAKHSPKLRRLVLYGLDQFTGDHLAPLGRLQHLETLDLAICAVTDGNLPELLAGSSQSLRRLNLFHCGKLTDAALDSLAVCAPNLTSLGLSSLPHITYDAVLALVTRCSSLRTVDLSGCQLLTDEQVAAVQRLLEERRGS